MFVILSFVKIFHWLVQDRVDFIETTPNVTRLQHARIVTFTLVLLVRRGLRAADMWCVFVWG
jgi:E3 ubiquitin-protein ligase synoviolin